MKITNAMKLDSNETTWPQHTAMFESYGLNEFDMISER